MTPLKTVSAAASSTNQKNHISKTGSFLVQQKDGGTKGDNSKGQARSFIGTNSNIKEFNIREISDKGESDKEPVAVMVQDTADMMNQQQMEMISLAGPSKKINKQRPTPVTIHASNKKADGLATATNSPNKRRPKDASTSDNFQGYDCYENDDMMDCFMDDIDEMSMCEGSR